LVLSVRFIANEPSVDYKDNIGSEKKFFSYFFVRKKGNTIIETHYVQPTAHQTIL
jgi:hypothetical protein